MSDRGGTCSAGFSSCRCTDTAKSSLCGKSVHYEKIPARLSSRPKPRMWHAGRGENLWRRKRSLPLDLLRSTRQAATSFSRRLVLQHTLAFTICHSALRPVAAMAEPGNVFAYVGTYNIPVEGSASNGKGIELFAMNAASGELRPMGLAAAGQNASWLALDPTKRFLYAANEVASFEGGSGSVTAYAVGLHDGSLRLLNRVSSEGAGPAHLSVDATGKHVFVANYAGGNAAVLPVGAGGELGPATCVVKDSGFVGSRVPASAPAGSFAFSGHDKPHAHMIQADPGNRFVLQTDLGQDRIYVYRLDVEEGRLVPADAPFAVVPAGDGPRHFVFHRNGRWMYALQEEASTVIFFHFDPSTGGLSPQQTVSTLPPSFKRTNFTSEIVLSPDGRFLYAANRLHDTVAIFSLDDAGRLSWLGETSTMGSYPRHIQIEPTGRFLYACNQRSDHITSFRIDRKTGNLAFTGQYTAVGSPACILFLT